MRTLKKIPKSSTGERWAALEDTGKAISTVRTAVSAELVVKALQEKCCHICRKYWCVAKWLQFIHITAAEISSFVHDKQFSSSSHGVSGSAVCLCDDVHGGAKCSHLTTQCFTRWKQFCFILPNEHFQKPAGSWQPVSRGIQIALCSNRCCLEPLT